MLTTGKILVTKKKILTTRKKSYNRKIFCNREKSVTVEINFLQLGKNSYNREKVLPTRTNFSQQQKTSHNSRKFLITRKKSPWLYKNACSRKILLIKNFSQQLTNSRNNKKFSQHQEKKLKTAVINNTITCLLISNKSVFSFQTEMIKKSKNKNT